MKKYKTIRLLAAALLLAAILPAAAPAAEGETFTVSYGKGYYFENPLTGAEATGIFTGSIPPSATVASGGSVTVAENTIRFRDYEFVAWEYSYTVMEDAGRGWRRVVASPRPQHIVEIETIRTLVDAGQVVVAAGGGGIPVMETEGNHLKGVPAVIDKDFCSARLAESVDADCLIILTAVEKVAINFGKPNQEWLDELTPERARQLISEGHFAPGSMLPKVQAALQFAESKPERYALITLLEKAKDGIAGKTGTIIR